MPTQVQRPPADPISVSSRSVQQHQALKLALGTILTPKRPYISSNSRPTSGTASPAIFGSHSASGTHTPATPPVSNHSSSSTYHLAQGPNSSEHLHPHYPHGHHGHPHGSHPPSRLGPGRSNSYSGTPSESSSTHASAPSTAHTSPYPGPDTLLTDVEPLSMPPPALEQHSKLDQTHHDTISPNHPEAPPPTPASPTNSSGSIDHGIVVAHVTSSEPINHAEVTINVLSPSASSSGAHSAASSGNGTPRAKFLKTLQSKSAWDALIHGSFS